MKALLYRPLSDNSISNSNIQWRNLVILNEGVVETTKKNVWEFGKKIRVTSKGNNDEIIRRLKGMENRDRQDEQKIDKE